MNTTKASTFTAATKVVVKRLAKRGMHGFVCAALAGMMGGRAQAADGTWDTNSAGNWTDITKWQGDSAYASGADSTATFGNVITADYAITLDAAITIGNITASDTSNNYTISGANILTLDRTDATPPQINVTQSGRTLTISSQISGSDGLAKAGAGTLTISANPTYTGATILNAGTLDVSGAGTTPLSSSSGVTFTGNSTFIYVLGSTLPAMTVNAGVTAQVNNASSGGNTGSTIASVTGSGTFSADNPGGTGQGKGITFNNMSSFTGVLQTALTGAGMYFQMPNLNDTVASNIRLTGAAGSTPQQFIYTGSSPLTLNNRAFEVAVNTSGGQVNIVNNGAGVFTINKDLIVTAPNAKTLSLGGSNTGTNTFAGAITNGSSAVISLIKADAGKWILTGTNTYTGNTTIADGTLEIRGAGQLGGGNYAGNISNTDTSPSSFTFDSSANQTLSGVISGTMPFIKDGTGTLALTRNNTYSGNTTVNAGTLSLGNGTSNSSLNDYSTLSVASGATLNLNYAGSDTVFRFNLGGSPAAAGEWGGTGTGAANTNAQITGSGRINNLGGDASSFNIGYWDGGTTNNPSDGNLASGGGNGTWNTTVMNWDYGFVAHKVWANTTLSSAVFGGTAGTVTLSEPVSLKNLTLSNTAGIYTLTGSTLNFTAGTITIGAKGGTIKSNITGAPAVTGNTLENGTGASFEPINGGNMDLGACSITGSGTAALYLRGASGSTGTVASSTSTKFYVGSGSWTLNGASTGNDANVTGGALTLKAKITTSKLMLLSGGVLNYNVANAVDCDEATSSSSNEGLRIQAGVSIDNTSSAAITTTIVQSMTWEGNWTFLGSNGANSDLNLGTGNVFLKAASPQVTVTHAATTLTIGGVIANDSTGGRGLTKAGDGTLELRGVNTYTGATTVNAGTLSGTGTIAGAVTVGALGTIAPGSKVAPTGTLTINNNCTIGNKLAIKVDGAQSSKLAVTGALTISGATLNVTEINPPTSTVLIIATYDTLVGTFATVNYAGNLVVDYNYNGLKQIVLRSPPGTVLLFR